MADPGRRLAVVHRMHGVDVGRRLVGVAASCLVDDDRAREVALGQAEPWTRRQRDRRAPPGVVHQVDGRADLDGRGDATAGVAGRAGRPVGADGGALVLLAHGLVLLEPAAGEHHAVARPEGRRLPVTGDVDPGDPAVLDDEAGQRRLVEDRHARVEQSLAQPDRHRLAHAVHRPAQNHVQDPAQPDLEHGQRASERAQSEAEPPVVRLHHDHAHGRLGVGRVQPGELVAEDPTVDRHRLDAAAPGVTAGSLRVVVGVVRDPDEPGRGVVADEGERLGPAVEEGVDPRTGNGVADDRVQVGPGLLGRVPPPGRPQCVVVGDPHAAPGAGGGAAEPGAALDHHRAQAVVRRGEGCGHAGAAAADHHHVVLRAGVIHAHLHDCAGRSARARHGGETVTGSNSPRDQPALRHGRARGMMRRSSENAF